MNRLRTVLWVIIGLLVLASAVPWLLRMPDAVSPGIADSPESLSEFSFNDPEPIDAYSEILRRPLFLASRRPADEGTKTGSGKPLLLGRYMVEGVVIAGQRRIVLIRQGAGDKVSRIIQGAELDGWKLAEVTRQHLVLEKAGQRQEFVLQQDTSGAE